MNVGAGRARDIRDRDVQDAQRDHDVHGGSAGRHLVGGRILADDAVLGNRIAVLVSSGARYAPRLLDGGLGLITPTSRFRTGLSRGAARARV